jgi:hypothetical protein
MKTTNGRWLTICALVACLSGMGIVAYAMFGGTENPQDLGRKVADPFLEKLRDGDTASAWDSTTAEFKSNQGRENFLRYVSSHPLLQEPLEFYAFNQVSVNKLPCGECLYGRQGSPGSGPKVHVLLAKELGTWKVERLMVDESK